MSDIYLLVTKLAIGFLISGAIAYSAYRFQALDRSGAMAALVLGAFTIGFGGSGWAVVLLTFFISASLLSILFRSRKTGAKNDYAKGSRRDAGQVLANGGVAGLLVVFYFILNWVNPESSLRQVLWLGFAASLAGASADTWATELGILNPRLPVMITSFKKAPAGTSGAISLVGSLGALGGASLVAGAAALMVSFGWAPEGRLPLGVQFLVITIGGTAGAFVDSLLGGTLQAVYYCPRCEKETERHPLHICGASTIQKRGWSWLNNDRVNTICTISAGLVGMMIGKIL